MMPSVVAIKAPFSAQPTLQAARQLFGADSFDTGDSETGNSETGGPETSNANRPAANAQTQSGSAGETPQIAWVEPAENLWLASLQSFGLTLMTFGVYHFWGRAEARRRTTNAVHINGQPLDHTGTGLEAFISFLIGTLVAITITTLFFSMMKGAPGTGIEGMRQIRWQRLTVSLPLLFLLGSVVYRRRQHLLRRTWLGGQRFDLGGHAWGYALHHFWMAFLVPLTLGWAAPWRASRLEAMKVRDMRHGETRFSAAPDLKPLYKAFALLWFGGGFLYFATLIVLSLNIGPQLLQAIDSLTLTPLADAEVIRRGLLVTACGLIPLSLFGLIYRKAMLEHRVSCIAFEDGRLRLSMPVTGYLALTLSNVALRVVSLGAFAPVAEARFMRYLIAHLTVDGRLPPVA